MPAAAGPDPSRLREFPLSIWYVKEGLTYTVRTVSEEYQGFFTHHKKRSEYCPGDRCQCRLRNERRIWLGYASIVRWEASTGFGCLACCKSLRAWSTALTVSSAEGRNGPCRAALATK